MSLHINNTYAKKRGIATGTLDPSAVLKKRSSIRTCHCHPAPHLCGNQEACQVNGRNGAVYWYRQLAKMSGKSVCMEPSLSLYGKPSLRETDQSCHRDVLDAPPPSQCETGRSRIPRKQTSSTNLEEEELAVRHQQGKKAEPLVRDHSREWYMSSVWHSWLPSAAVSASSQTPGLSRQGVHRVNLSPWAAISMLVLLLSFLSLSFQYSCHITPCTSHAQSSPKKKKIRSLMHVCDGSVCEKAESIESSTRCTTTGRGPLIAISMCRKCYIASSRREDISVAQFGFSRYCQHNARAHIKDMWNTITLHEVVETDHNVSKGKEGCQRCQGMSPVEACMGERT